MPVEVLMPALSPTMTEGKIARWLKKPGDAVRAGDVLAEIETDKATMEMEAVDEGTLARILVPEGSENVAVNLPIAVIASEGENVDAAAKSAPAAPRPASPAPAAPVEQVAKDAPRPAAAPAAAAGKSPRRRRSGMDRPVRHDHRARGAARRHRRGDAARRRRVPAGRGGRRVPGRLQGEPGPAAGIRRAPRHRHAHLRARVSPGSASARPWRACVPSSSS